MFFSYQVPTRTYPDICRYGRHVTLVPILSCAVSKGKNETS